MAPPGLKDDDGIQVHSTTLRLNGASIVASSDGYPLSWAIEAEHNILNADGTSAKVDSSRLQPLTGGVCDRTPAVRNAIVVAVAAAELLAGDGGAPGGNDRSAHCQWPDLAQAVGDFAGLSGLQVLTIYGTGIETLPVGLFDGLDSLEESVYPGGADAPAEGHLPRARQGLAAANGGPSRCWTVPQLYTRGRSAGRHLRAACRRQGVRQGGFRFTQIFGNPGYGFFRGGAFVAPALYPRAADAGPGGTLSAGQTVTLGGPGNDGGIWGSNVGYLWQQRDGTGAEATIVTLSNEDRTKNYRHSDVSGNGCRPQPRFHGAGAGGGDRGPAVQLRLDGGKGDGSTIRWAPCLVRPQNS